MAEDTETAEPDQPKKKSRLKPLILGVVLAAVLGGGGFYAVWSGLLLGPPAAEGEAHTAAEDAPATDVEPPDVAFVAIDPIVVSLASDAGPTHLRFSAELEVVPGEESEVRRMMPRIVDALNGYLRAVGIDELRDSGALILLRAQMLRRVQIIVGDGRIQGLLITEFVLS